MLILIFETKIKFSFFFFINILQLITASINNIKRYLKPIIICVVRTHTKSKEKEIFSDWLKMLITWFCCSCCCCVRTDMCVRRQCLLICIKRWKITTTTRYILNINAILMVYVVCQHRVYYYFNRGYMYVYFSLNGEY